MTEKYTNDYIDGEFLTPETGSIKYYNHRLMAHFFNPINDNKDAFGFSFVGNNDIITKKCKIANTDPTPTDDVDSRFGIFSQWYNPDNGKLFECLDPTVGSAIWRQLTNKPNTVTYTLTNTDESTTVTHNLGYIPNVTVLDSNGKEIGVDINHDLGTKNSFTVSADINESNLDSLDIIIKYYP